MHGQRHDRKAIGFALQLVRVRRGGGRGNDAQCSEELALPMPQRQEALRLDVHVRDGQPKM